MSNPRPGAATEEMVQIAKDEDINSLDTSLRNHWF
jgi:hypothetical protein